jgi:hypothetical protein
MVKLASLFTVVEISFTVFEGNLINFSKIRNKTPVIFPIAVHNISCTYCDWQILKCIHSTCNINFTQNNNSLIDINRDRRLIFDSVRQMNIFRPSTLHPSRGLPSANVEPSCWVQSCGCQAEGFRCTIIIGAVWLANTSSSMCVCVRVCAHLPINSHRFISAPKSGGRCSKSIGFVAGRVLLGEGSSVWPGK